MLRPLAASLQRGCVSDWFACSRALDSHIIEADNIKRRKYFDKPSDAEFIAFVVGMCGEVNKGAFTFLKRLGKMAAEHSHPCQPLQVCDAIRVIQCALSRCLQPSSPPCRRTCCIDAHADDPVIVHRHAAAFTYGVKLKLSCALAKGKVEQYKLARERLSLGEQFGDVCVTRTRRHGGWSFCGWSVGHSARRRAVSSVCNIILITCLQARTSFG